jgi:PAS domain S-box-containing protein
MLHKFLLCFSLLLVRVPTTLSQNSHMTEQDWVSIQKIVWDVPEEVMIIDHTYKIRSVSQQFFPHIQPSLPLDDILGMSIKLLAIGRVHNPQEYIDSIRFALHDGVSTTIKLNNHMGSQYELDNIPLKNSKGMVYAIKHQIRHVIVHTPDHHLRLLKMESEIDNWKILVNSLTDHAIFVLNTENMIQTWSRQCEDIYGWKEDEVVGKSYKILEAGLHHGSLNIPSKPQPIPQQTTTTKVHRKKNGLTFLVDERIFPIKSHGVHVGNSVINKDMRAATKSQTMLLEAKEQSQTLQNNLLSSISHESRTNTAIIISSIETLLDTKLDSAQREICNDIHQASRVLLQTINDMLDFSSFMKNGVHLHPVMYEIRSSIENTIKLQKVALRADENAETVLLTYRVHDDVPTRILGDEIRVSQILSNLINNSIKFTDNGFIHVTVTKEKPMYRDKLHLAISVQDSGIGIPAEQQSLLFTPFYQADANLNRKHTGTGLGLSNVKMLVEAMSGTITLSSETEGEHHGSTFVCHLHFPLSSEFEEPFEEPLCMNSNDVMEKSPTNPKRKMVIRQRSYSVPVPYLSARIMVAEDNKVLASIAKRVLNNLGFSDIVWVENGQLALEEAINMQKDLILMDLQMPVMDGLEATRQIRLFDKRVIIIAVSANALASDVKMCQDAGMNTHLAKPLSMEELKNNIMYYFPAIFLNENHD